MNITYRKSEDADEAIIKELIAERFGNRDKYDVTKRLNNRYLLAFDGDKLIAMTGLMNSGYYNGLEVDWTCISKGYEGKGIITDLMSKLVNNTDKDIYCSCWRLMDNPKVNLHHSMEKLGFKPAIYGRLRANSEHNNCKDICVAYQEGCYCCEDLYLRKNGGNKDD